MRRSSITLADAIWTGERKLDWSNQCQVPSIVHHTGNGSLIRLLFCRSYKTGCIIQSVQLSPREFFEASQPRSKVYSTDLNLDTKPEDHRVSRMRHVHNHLDLSLSLVAAA